MTNEQYVSAVNTLLQAAKHLDFLGPGELDQGHAHRRKTVDVIKVAIAQLETKE